MEFHVFGYGSLMWDGWECEFKGENLGLADLAGYRRAFNKLSTRNWGSRKTPGPTLGLEHSVDGSCTGVVFRFSALNHDAVFTLLRKREGPDFELRLLPIRIRSAATEVSAVVAVNKVGVASYAGGIPLAARAAMAVRAVGSSGSCVEYVTRVSAGMNKALVQDAAIVEFENAVRSRDVIAAGEQWLNARHASK